MTNPAKLAQYVGFTESDVQTLCSEFHMDFESMQIWYDGYSFSRVSHVYSPNSVINAVQNEEFRAYWSSSESYESLKNYITEDFDGLKDAIVQMLGGRHVHVDTMTFQNDMTSFKSRDDIITLLIHLGYLAYDSTKEEVYIPNREVADAFRSAIKGSSWTEVNKALSQSEKLFKAINGSNIFRRESEQMDRQTAALMAAMIRYDYGDTPRIQHFVKVHDLAAAIGILEGLDEETQHILETAAILHDIGIHVSEVKYGSSSGHYQEIEGPAEAEKLLHELGGYSEEEIERVKYLIGHHHTYKGIDGVDYQILVEADFLVNLYESSSDAHAIAAARKNIFRTSTGLQFLEEMFAEHRK